MAAALKVLFLAAEAEPFVKIGGLGDVAGSLPRYLRGVSEDSRGSVSIDARLVLPLHPVLRFTVHGLRLLATFELPHNDGPRLARILEGRLGEMPVYFIDGSPISGSGSVYASDPELDAEKYLFFSLAAARIPDHLNWKPDVVHVNDWHTAVAGYELLLQRRAGRAPVATVLTLHNLSYLGPDVRQRLGAYGLTPMQTGLPDWARGLPLALGLWAADAIVAVSPQYAQEIQTPKFGCGLHNFLRARRESLTGILNGIDTESFNPATDPALASNFGRPTLERRSLNKTALQVRTGLASATATPCLGVVSRLDRQKGTDLMPQAFARLTDIDWQAVILGTGDERLEKSMLRLQTKFPERVRVHIGYDSGLARQIYAGADILLMPSRNEPCGLAQMIGMRYGCIPVVSGVGGLKDTIVDGKTGFVTGGPSMARLEAAVRRALLEIAQPDRWAEIQHAAMSQDFSWAASARQYASLYRRLATPGASRHSERVGSNAA